MAGSSLKLRSCVAGAHPVDVNYVPLARSPLAASWKLHRQLPPIAAGLRGNRKLHLGRRKVAAADLRNASYLSALDFFGQRLFFRFRQKRGAAAADLWAVS